MEHPTLHFFLNIKKNPLLIAKSVAASVRSFYMNKYTASKTADIISFPSGFSAGQDNPVSDDNVPNKVNAQESASIPHGVSDTEPSYGKKHCPPKEDIVNVGKEVGISAEDQQIVPEYRRKNYPGEYKCWDNMKQRCKRGEGVLDPRFERFVDFMSYLDYMPYLIS